MSNFNTKSRAVLAAAWWVFGGDGKLEARENSTIHTQVNRSSPWHVTYLDTEAVFKVFRKSGLHLSDVVNSIEKDHAFSTEEKYQLFAVVCGAMNSLGQGDRSQDGWDRVMELGQALSIDIGQYNQWAKNK